VLLFILVNQTPQLEGGQIGLALWNSSTHTYGFSFLTNPAPIYCKMQAGVNYLGREGLMNVIEDSYHFHLCNKACCFAVYMSQPIWCYNEQILIWLAWKDLNNKADAKLAASCRGVTRSRTSFQWSTQISIAIVYTRGETATGTARRRGLSKQSGKPTSTSSKRRQCGFRLELHRWLRLALFPRADYKLIWTFHHALLDGRSFFYPKGSFAFIWGILPNRTAN